MSAVNSILFKSAENMSEVKNNSAQLVVLSPPYLGHHSKKEKENEKDFLIRILSECKRIVSRDGVVVCVNTDFKDNGMIYLRHMVLVEAAKSIGLMPKDEKIWIRGFKRNQFRKKFSFVIVFCKEKKIFQNRFPEYECDNWIFVKSQIINDFRDAIAPEIPTVLVKNFTKKDDLVVSACAGTGTVVIAAQKEGRRAIGYEINPEMRDLIIAREQTFSKYLSPVYFPL
ncbi:MAG: DNA methyltransferase [Syntrophales bacterium]|nr:DNA methyltransferase [Syntrophales bacterium]